LLVIGLGGFVAAQPKAGETALLNQGGLYGNALIALGKYGNITSILPLPAGMPSGIAVHDLGGPDLILDGRKIYTMKNRVLQTLTASLALPGRDLQVDEDGTYVIAADTAVLTLNRFKGTRGTLLTGLVGAETIALRGSDGTMLVAEPFGNRILSVERFGTVKAVTTIQNPRCMVWDPFTGGMFVAADGALYLLHVNGTRQTLSVGTPGLSQPVGLFLRSDRTLLVAQGGPGPTGIYAYHGDTGRFNRALIESPSPAAGISPADLTVEHSRDLWPNGEARVGESLGFRVNFPQFKQKPWVAALSFGHAPGIQLGYYRLHLNPDPLFYASLNNRALFQGSGILSNDGTAVARLHIPDIPGLAGLRIYAGAVVPDAARYGGVGIVSYAMGFTIQPAAR